MTSSSNSANEGQSKSFWGSAPIFRTRSPIAPRIKMDSSLRMYNLATSVIAVVATTEIVKIITTINLVVVILS